MTAADYAARDASGDPRRAARGRDVPLDRQLAHRVRHRRPLSAAPAVDAPFEAELRDVTSSASAWPATTSRSTAPRFVPLDVALHICVAAATTSAPTCWRRSRDVLSERRPRRTARSASSIPTTSRSASRSTCRPIVAAAQAVEGVEAVTAVDVPAPARRRASAHRHRRDRDRPARDRAARQRPELPRARRARADRGRRQVSARRASGSCTCGCCDGRADARRRSAVDNRPGLIGDRLPHRHLRRLPRALHRRARRRGPAGARAAAHARRRRLHDRR